MCVHSRARARAHTAVSTAPHMHNSGATNASSHVGERNIKKRAEHKAMGRRGRETAHKGKRKEEEVEERTREPKEGAGSEGRRRETPLAYKRRGLTKRGCVRNRKKRETLTR